MFVRVRVLEEEACWKMLRMLGGREFDMFGICRFIICVEWVNCPGVSCWVI